MRPRTLLVALIAVLASACTDILPPDGGGGDFTVTVGSGTQPSYSWQGGDAFRVEVTRVENPLIPVWAIANPATRDIRSPVRHGSVPSGAILLADEETTLEAGQRYRVRVTLADNRQGAADFRP